MMSKRNLCPQKGPKKMKIDFKKKIKNGDYHSFYFLSYLYLIFYYYCCTGGTLWHLQKFLQYNIVISPPPLFFFILPPPFLE
jgi:hypothetical protein